MNFQKFNFFFAKFFFNFFSENLKKNLKKFLEIFVKKIPKILFGNLKNFGKFCIKNSKNIFELLYYFVIQKSLLKK